MVAWHEEYAVAVQTKTSAQIIEEFFDMPILLVPTRKR
jgi:hypothetical protein